MQPEITFHLPILIIVPEKESMWNDRRYAPRRKPNTGPKAAILYIHPRKRKRIRYECMFSEKVLLSVINEFSYGEAG